MNLAITYVMTLSEAITFWLVVTIIVVFALLLVANEVMKFVNRIRQKAFDRKIAKIERKLKEKNNG